jgi:uncharacterized protein YceK
MAVRAIYVAVLLSSLPSAGCGTVVNLVRPGPAEGAKIPFGGVKQDVSGLKEAANGECGSKTRPKSESEQHPQVARMVFYAVDLPFSCIGDVVTWPYTATYTYINQSVPVPPVMQPPAYGLPQTSVPSTTSLPLSDAKSGQ